MLERLAHRIRGPGAGSVESFLRGIEFVQHEQRLATFFLEGHRGDGSTVTTFVIAPDEARVRYHFEVFAEEGGLRKQVALMTASMMVVDTSTGPKD